jgi:hypothetical protein
MNSEAVAPFQLVLPDLLWELIRRCETQCVAGCCGLDAFDRNPKDLLPWLREHQDEFFLVLDHLSDCLRLVGEQRHTIQSQQQFNASWDTQVECLQFLREWRETILTAAEKVYGRSLPTIDSAWRTSDVLALAKGIYEERAFDRMPILADALQDAGCTNDDILNHCRDTGTPHARGCWVVDLVLEKA